MNEVLFWINYGTGVAVTSTLLTAAVVTATARLMGYRLGISCQKVPARAEQVRISRVEPPELENTEDKPDIVSGEPDALPC